MADAAKRNAPTVLRGSVVKVRRKCGKKMCRCARGELHETWALSFSQQGRTRMIPLRSEDVQPARQAIARYRKAMKQLQLEADRHIRRLHAVIKASRRRVR